MGRLVNGINGPIQGKVGAVVGSSWKGIPYIKAAYKKRTKNISNKELENRRKFALSQEFLQPLLEVVRVGFKDFSPRSEGFVAAKSHLLLHAMEGEGADRVINPALVKISHGDLPLSGNISVSLTEPGRLQFTWDTAYVEGGHNRDQVLLLAYDVDKGLASHILYGQFRFTGADQLAIASGSGYTYHLYLAFIAHDRSRQSHSKYLGSIST